MNFIKKTIKINKPSSIKILLGLLCVLTLCQNEVKSQSIVDSLKNEIKLASGNDSLQIQLYLNLGFEYKHKGGGEKTLALVDTIFKLSNGKNYNQLMLANNLYGYIKNYQEKFDEAIYYYEKAIEAGNKGLLTEDKKRANKIEKFLSQISDNIANVYQHKGELEKAIEIRLQGVEQLEKLDDTIGMIISYCNIGCTYIMIKDVRVGIDYLNKSRAISENSKYKFILPNVYANMGLGYTRLNEKDSALVYYLKCRKVYNNKKLDRGHFNNEANIATLYLSRKDTIKSNETFEQLFMNFRDTNENQIYYWKLLYAESLYKQGRFKKAEELLSTVKGKISIVRPVVKKLYGEVGYKINLQRENYKDALSFSELYHSAKDSIYNLKSDSSFKAIESIYNVAKKQKTIDKQEIELKNQTLYLIGLLGVLIILGFFFYSYRNKKQYQSKLAEEKQRAKDIEIKSLKKENKIISMQSMLEGQEEERKRIAQDLHDSIGTLMTSIKLKFISVQKEIEQIQQMNITDELDEMINSASQQVRRISHQMTPRVLEIAGLEGAINELESQLTSQKIKVTFNNKNLDLIQNPSSKINLYRIIQEMFNNIAKHAQASEVNMQSNVSNNMLNITIKDNGVGMDKTIWAEDKSTGVNSIKSRIEYLEGTIELRVENGTEYRIKIPIK